MTQERRLTSGKVRKDTEFYTGTASIPCRGGREGASKLIFHTTKSWPRGVGVVFGGLPFPGFRLGRGGNKFMRGIRDPKRPARTEEMVSPGRSTYWNGSRSRLSGSG